jgi:hypothetical protein
MRLAATVLGLIVLASTAVADPIDYVVRLEVQAKTVIFSIPDDIGFGGVSVGDVYWGTFTSDDSVLLMDGDEVPGLFSAFRVQLGGLVWDMSDAGSAFSGFRGPLVYGGSASLGAPSPGVRVSGGEIVDLYGGVHGSDDIPFVDFGGVNDFLAYDGAVQLAGSLTVAPIPEPSTLVLLGLCVVGLFVITRLRQAT